MRRASILRLPDQVVSVVASSASEDTAAHAEEWKVGEGSRRAREQHVPTNELEANTVLEDDLFRIEAGDLQDFGFTRGCRKCDKLLAGSTSQPSLGHSQTCRARVSKAMLERGSESQKRRVRDAAENVTVGRIAD